MFKNKNFQIEIFKISRNILQFFNNTETTILWINAKLFYIDTKLHYFLEDYTKMHNNVHFIISYAFQNDGTKFFGGLENLK